MLYAGTPLPQDAQTRERAIVPFLRPLRLTLLGAFARLRRPRDHAGSKETKDGI